MANDWDGYSGTIPKSSATVAEVLRNYGYSTGAWGKWHNTPAEQTTAADGVHDARTGRVPYFWALFTRPGERRGLLREGWTAVGRVIALGVVMDVVYQIIIFRRIHPLEMIVIVLLLAFVPYLLLRGPVNRIARFWMHRHRRPA